MVLKLNLSRDMFRSYSQVLQAFFKMLQTFSVMCTGNPRENTNLTLFDVESVYSNIPNGYRGYRILN